MENSFKTKFWNAVAKEFSNKEMCALHKINEDLSYIDDPNYEPPSREDVEWYEDCMLQMNYSKHLKGN